MLVFHRALYVDHRNTLLDGNLQELYAYKDIASALEEDVDSILANPSSCVLFAEDEGGEVLGYITGHIERDTRRVLEKRGVVEDWYVEPDARGEGVGRALLDALLAVFRESGCVVAESSTFPLNAGARRQHEKAGFHEIEIRYRMKI